MGFVLRLIAGLAGLAGLLKLLERRQSTQPRLEPHRPVELTAPEETDPAEELRRRLAAARSAPEPARSAPEPARSAPEPARSAPEPAQEAPAEPARGDGAEGSAAGGPGSARVPGEQWLVELGPEPSVASPTEPSETSEPQVQPARPDGPGDPSTDAAAWIAERRSRIHARAQQAIETMSELDA